MAALPGFLTAAEAAQIVGCSYAALTRYVRQGKIKAMRVGQVMLIEQADAYKFKKPPRGNPDFSTDKNPRKTRQKTTKRESTKNS